MPLQLPQDQLSRAASAIAFLLLVLNSLLPVRVGIASMVTAPPPPRIFPAYFVRASCERCPGALLECGVWAGALHNGGYGILLIRLSPPGGRELA